MFSKQLPFSGLLAQGRWKVEFFIPGEQGARSHAFPSVPLRHILADRRGTIDPQQYPDHLFNYLGLEHIQSNTGDLVDAYAPRAGREVLSRSKVFYSGDVLYGRLRPSLNKVFVAIGEISEGICSGEFYVLIPDPKRILPQFARALLASRYIQHAVCSMTTGSALPRLALTDLLDIEVPLPPMEVQRQYEEAIIQRSANRKQWAARMRNSHSSDLETLVDALENGNDLIFSTPTEQMPAQHQSLKLPPTATVSRQRRGRSIFSDDGSSIQ